MKIMNHEKYEEEDEEEDDVATTKSTLPQPCLEEDASTTYGVSSFAA